MVMEPAKTPTVLVIGGLDPTGGAGILADAAAVRSRGLHCAAVSSVVTVQDARSFAGATVADPEEVRAAVRVVQDGQTTRAVKTGALGNRLIVEAVAQLAADPGFPPLVVDPVLRSTSGGELLDSAGLTALREQLVPHAALLTPNLSEAEEITRHSVSSEEEMLTAAERILELGAEAVLVKGGHLPGARIADLLLVRGAAPRWFRGARTTSGNIRGTGCTLASLIAAELALGQAVGEAVERGRAAHQRALRAPLRLGADLLVPGLSPRTVGDQ